MRAAHGGAGAPPDRRVLVCIGAFVPSMRVDLPLISIFELLQDSRAAAPDAGHTAAPRVFGIVAILIVPDADQSQATSACFQCGAAAA